MGPTLLGSPDYLRDHSIKKSGETYRKDDRVTVFRINKDGGQEAKNALELLMEQV